MKCIYRVSIDYEVEIIERIPFLNLHRVENLARRQQVMDAFVMHRDILMEFNKGRLYEGLLDSDAFGNDLGKYLRVMDKKEIWHALARHLSPETAAYVLGLVYPGKAYNGTAAEQDNEQRLLFSRFGDFVPLAASFKEIGNENESADNLHELQNR
jgi:hypothetical protein